MIEAPVTLKMPVQWGDMDSAQHVNNIMYLRWCESARIEYFRMMGMDMSFRGETGPILGWQDCKYIFPLTYPDTALVSCNVIEIKEDRFIMICEIHSQRHKRLSAISKQSIIPYNYELLAKTEIPSTWHKAINELQKSFK